MTNNIIDLEMKPISIPFPMASYIGLDFEARGPISIALPMTSYVGLDFEVSPHIEVISPLYVNVGLEMSSYINIDCEIDLNEKEFLIISQELGDKVAERRIEIGRMVLVHGRSIKDVCEKFGITKSTAYRDLNIFKSEEALNLKKDYKSNTRVMTYLIKNLESLKEVDRRLWADYYVTAKNVQDLKVIYDFEYSKINLTDLKVKTNMENIARLASQLDSMERTKVRILDSLRRTQKSFVETLESFGLTNEAAMDAIVGSGDNDSTNYNNFQNIIVEFGKIIHRNIKDPAVRGKIFIEMKGKVTGISPPKEEVVDAELA